MDFGPTIRARPKKNTYTIRENLGHAWGHGPSCPRPKSAPDKKVIKLRHSNLLLTWIEVFSVAQSANIEHDKTIH